MKLLQWLKELRISRLQWKVADLKDRSRRAVCRGSMSMAIDYGMEADELLEKIEKLKGQP